MLKLRSRTSTINYLIIYINWNKAELDAQKTVNAIQLAEKEALQAKYDYVITSIRKIVAEG